MAGHSRWANIKHKKGAADARRSKVWTKLVREITVAARLGGGDPGANPRLRLAMDKARLQQVPRDTIDRGIKKGTGELEGETYEEITYEGYGPCGVAVIVECMTSNKVRTVAEVRHAFSKSGGAMGESGSVAWGFDRKGTITVDASTTSEEALFEKAIDAGAEDIRNDGDVFTVLTTFEDFAGVSEKLAKSGVTIKESGFAFIPKNTVRIENEDDARKIITLIETLEDDDDVQNVWPNFDIDDELLQKL